MEKVWLKSYPEGVPEEVADPPWRSVRDLCEHSFAAFPDRPAYTCMGKTLTYADLNNLSMQFERSQIQSATGTVVAGPGEVSGSFLNAAVQVLGLSSTAAAPPSPFRPPV